MGFNLFDIIKDKLEWDFRKGHVYVVKTLPFYEKTKIRLFNQDNDKYKSRPIIIKDSFEGQIVAFAISSKKPTLVFTKLHRKKINLQSCKLNKDDCFRLIFKDTAYIFILNDKKDYKFSINPKIFKELINENNAKYCGKCEDSIIKEVEKFYSGD